MFVSHFSLQLREELDSVCRQSASFIQTITSNYNFNNMLVTKEVLPNSEYTFFLETGDCQGLTVWFASFYNCDFSNPFPSDCHKHPLAISQRELICSFMMTDDCQMVADQSLCLCYWDLIHFTPLCHHDCCIFKMADKLASHAQWSHVYSSCVKQLS